MNPPGSEGSNGSKLAFSRYPLLVGIAKEGMMYIVFARKYRPQTLNDVIGQDISVKTIKNAIEKERLYHSILFYGLMGTGKTSLARIIAKSLNCVNGPTISPCGVCEQCKAITRGKSVDVIEIDGASNRRIDDARNIIESIKYLPLNSRYKIFIIDEVHMLTEEAFNALLKTIEEPPDYVKFIFATTNIEKVPQTVLSRCQIFKLNKISPRDIFLKLRKISEAEKINIDDDAVKLISQISQGSFRVAENFLDRVVAYKLDHISPSDVSKVLEVADFSLVTKYIEAIKNFDKSSVFAIIDFIEENNLNIETFLEMFLDKMMSEDIQLELKTAILKFFYEAFVHIKYKIGDLVALKIATQKALALNNLTKIEEIIELSASIGNMKLDDNNDVKIFNTSQKSLDMNFIKDSMSETKDQVISDKIDRTVIDMFGGEIIDKKR